MTDVAIPKQHKAIVYDKPGQCSTKIETLETPEPGSGEVLINLTHSGVCHSDLGIMENSWASLPYPTQAGQIGGHEGVGKIVKFGPGAEKSTLKIGDRVGVKWEAATPGTFQEYCIGPANYVTPIPDGLESADAAPMLCAGVTTYAALRKSGVKSGQWIVISGAGGGLGHIAVQLAARGMAMRVIGIDAPAKKQLVMDCGAEYFVDVTAHDDKSIAEEVTKLTGDLGASGVIVCTASNRAYAQAIGFLRFGGTLVCVGMPEGEPQPIAKSFPQALVFKQANIAAVAVGSRKDAIECLDFAARGIVKTHFSVEKMDKLTDVFQQMKEGTLVGRVVLDLQG